MYINQIIRFKGYNGFIIETGKIEMINCMPKSSNSVMVLSNHDTLVNVL